MDATRPEHSKRIIKIPKVSDKTGLCKTAVYNLIAEGKFPKQIPLGARSVGWLESEIDGWIDDRISERDNEMRGVAC